MLTENPLSFITKKHLPDLLVEYRNLFEVCQGGPEVGDLHINNKKVEGYQFGGPFLINQHIIYIPAYLSRKFKLVCINIITNKINTLGDFHALIFPYNIKGNKIYCYTNLEGTESLSISVIKTYL